jgi:ribosomal-protein-alanine N-acetyltransferase
MRLSLIGSDPHTEARLANDAEYLSALEAEDWGRLAAAMQRVVGRDPPGVAPVLDEPHWGGYFARDDESGEVVGTCAFKGPPTDEGVVEIAYLTYPEFEGRGYATEMARRLVALAGASGEVRRVIAHTLREEGASTRVLERVGMTFEGDVVDPDDGPVWRWQLEVSPG